MIRKTFWTSFKRLYWFPRLRRYWCHYLMLTWLCQISLCLVTGATVIKLWHWKQLPDRSPWGTSSPLGGSNIITFWSRAIDKSSVIKRLCSSTQTLKSSSISCCKYFAIIYFARKTNALGVVGSSCIYTWRKLIKAKTISLLTFLTFFFFPFFLILKRPSKAATEVVL